MLVITYCTTYSRVLPGLIKRTINTTVCDSAWNKIPAIILARICTKRQHRFFQATETTAVYNTCLEREFSFSKTEGISACDNKLHIAGRLAPQGVICCVPKTSTMAWVVTCLGDRGAGCGWQGGGRGARARGETQAENATAGYNVQETK